MFVRWIRRAIKRMSCTSTTLIGDSGWSLINQDDDAKSRSR